jgi:protein-disulfide isomerase
MQPQSTHSIAIPIAIVLGFGLIAAAIFFSGGSTVPTPVTNPNDTPTDTEVTGTIRPVDETDFIKGNPNAPIMIVEYSDYDCPFCKAFHDTMNLIMDEYGATGNVAWVYRQFPILGPSSVRSAEAAYCVGKLGGSSAYFAFSDAVFEREAGSRTNMARLSDYANIAGVDVAAFESCLESGEMKARVEAALADGQAANVQGTPHSIVLVGDQQAVISGAQPYSVVRGIIETLLTQLEG